MPVDGDKKTNSITGYSEVFSGALNAWISDVNDTVEDEVTQEMTEQIGDPNTNFQLIFQDILS